MDIPIWGIFIIPLVKNDNFEIEEVKPKFAKVYRAYPIVWHILPLIITINSHRDRDRDLFHVILQLAISRLFSIQYARLY